MRRTLIIYTLIIFVISFIVVTIIRGTLAEQSGSSPESGSTSKLKTIDTALTNLSYGSIAAGSWGNWGTMWNRVYSAAQGSFNDALVAGIKNGGGTGAIISPYPKTLGGVDDYNRNQTIPTDTYKKTWITCNSANNYCGTGRSVLNGLVSQDPNTNLVWSPRISSSSTWFIANNCIVPGDPGSLGATCTADTQPGCVCVKNTGTKTGCENYDDGLWRLPYQKELMQAYIDGSWGNLATAGASYWSSTTNSDYTQNAWYTYLYGGLTYSYTKTTAYSVRCVR